MVTPSIWELNRDGKISPELFDYGMTLNTYWLSVYDGIEKIEDKTKNLESLVNDESFQQHLKQAHDLAYELTDFVEEMQKQVCETALKNHKERSENDGQTVS